MDHATIMAHLNAGDRFCAANAIRLVSVGKGTAEGVLEADADKLNGVNTVQGGAIFTLCDLAFAGAANSENEGMVAMSGSINFIRPGTGPRLRAVAKEISRGRCTGVYEVQVFDAENRLVAVTTITGFATGKPLIGE